MKLKLLLLLSLISIHVRAADVQRSSFSGISIYAMQWNNLLMYNMSLDKFRKVSEMKLVSSDQTFAADLARVLKIDSIQASNTIASDSFITYVVLDFLSGDNISTYISDGAQLCTEDMRHCINVDSDFKKRFDPSYNK
jgi:hypothetical protein